MCFACVQQARSSPEKHSSKPGASSLWPTGLPQGGSCSLDELFWQFVSCNLLSQGPQHTALPQQHDQKFIPCMHTLHTAPAKWHVHVGTCVSATSCRDHLLLCFFVERSPTALGDCSCIPCCKVHMLSSTPNSCKSRCFRSGNPLTYVPQLFAGASDEKLNIGTGWCVTQSTSIMELGHVRVVSPEKRARKTILCSTVWYTAHVAHCSQKVGHHLITAWKLSMYHLSEACQISETPKEPWCKHTCDHR